MSSLGVASSLPYLYAYLKIDKVPYYTKCVHIDEHSLYTQNQNYNNK